MSQHDMSLANAAGAAFRADLNDALAALVSNSSGATAPSTTFAYQWWADTTTGILKRRNAANSAWISVMDLAGGLIIGADVQAYDASLSSLAGLSLAQGDLLYATAADTLARLAKGTANQQLRMNSGATAPEWHTPTTSGITLGTPVASTSGTSIDFTSIPAGVKRITITFDGVSLSGSDAFLIQLGDSGGVETTGYKSGLFYYAGASGGATTSTAGFICGMTAGSGGGANTYQGSILLTRYNSTHAWVCQWGMGFQDGNTGACGGGGAKTLSAELDRVRIDTTGTDTFDAGTINITYE